MRRIGAALLAAGAMLWLAVALAARFPTSAYALEAKIREAGTLDARRILLAAGDVHVHSYDAANDTTYLFVATCSHSLCGPVVPVKGDQRQAGLRGPILLTPLDDTLALVPAGPPDANASRDVQRGDSAYSSLFELRSAWPIFLPRLVAIGLVAAGAGVLARPSWPAAIPGALGATIGLLVARAPMFIIFSQIAILPLAFAAIITGLVTLIRKKPGWSAAGILLFGVTMLAASFLAFFHFPPGEGA